jgi:hypothetical protein
MFMNEGHFYLPIHAPITFHLELYHYWLSKRRLRSMPSRSDIDPLEIPRLLPYVGIVEKAGDELRYRLVGTALAQQFGRDFTGKTLGSDVSDKPEAVQAMRATARQIFAAGRPVFITGEYETKLGNIHNASALVLPLSDNDSETNMVIFTRLARFSLGSRPAPDWLKGAPLTIQDAVTIENAIGLERRCLDWERLCHPVSESLSA